MLGSVKLRRDVSTTVLNNFVRNAKDSYEKFAGILTVNAYVKTDGDVWAVAPSDRSYKGHLHGLSESMLKTLSGPIKDLGIPIVYRILSFYRQDGRGVGGTWGPGAHASQFNIGVNELGKTWASNRYRWQRDAVERIGGEGKILEILGNYTLKQLNIEADKD